MQQGDFQSAVAKFEEAAQLNESDPLFANNAGFAYYKLGRNQDSLYWFNKAIEIDPNRAVAYLNLGDAYAKAEQHCRSLARLREILGAGTRHQIGTRSEEKTRRPNAMSNRSLSKRF